MIAEEAIVSGRASAMNRFEQFRLLLKEQLAVSGRKRRRSICWRLTPDANAVTAAPSEIETSPPPPTMAPPGPARGSGACRIGSPCLFWCSAAHLSCRLPSCSPGEGPPASPMRR